VSSHTATEMVTHHKKVYKDLDKDELFLAWLRKQPKQTRQEVHLVML
jgi:hypothetical protein